MKLAVLNQCRDGETRVALVPPVIKKLIALGVQVHVAAGAGAGAHHDDGAYRDVGATVVDTINISEADIVTTVAPLDASIASQVKDGTIVVGMLAPLKYLDVMQTLAKRRATTFAMEFVPRISRAQAADALSSQANIAGYKAVLMAADRASKIFPMMMTAAGTIAPCKVFVIGAGVAGLQAIATAKRLGGVVEAFDVRPVVKEQVQSLGARFVELPIAKDDAQTAGGYAKQLTDDQRKQQTELMAKHVIGADCVITTAAIFGKAPPLLIPQSVVDQMNAGAVLIDMAADLDADRGNCEATQPGKVITTTRGTIIDGTLNLPALVPVHASQAYANNIFALLKQIIHDGQIKLDMDDEIQKGAAITHNGEIVNELVKQNVESK